MRNVQYMLNIQKCAGFCAIVSLIILSLFYKSDRNFVHH